MYTSTYIHMCRVEAKGLGVGNEGVLYGNDKGIMFPYSISTTLNPKPYISPYSLLTTRTHLSQRGPEEFLESSCSDLKCLQCSPGDTPGSFLLGSGFRVHVVVSLNEGTPR